MALFQDKAYTAEWYYKLHPGFYNEQCYHIMAEYSANPERFQQEDQAEQPTTPPPFQFDNEGVEETKENVNMCGCVRENKNAKRKHEEVVVPDLELCDL